MGMDIIPEIISSRCESKNDVALLRNLNGGTDGSGDGNTERDVHETYMADDDLVSSPSLVIVSHFLTSYSLFLNKYISQQKWVGSYVSRNPSDRNLPCLFDLAFL